MGQVVTSILALFISLILLVIGNSLLGTTLALRLEIESFKASSAGIVLACYSVGFVLGSIYCVRIIQRVGHIRAFATFAAIATAVTLIHPFYITQFSWMILRLVMGFCLAGLMLVTESWVNARASSETRATLLAVYMVIFYLAAASGQFLLALGDPALHQLFTFAGILVALSLVPISLTRSPAPEIHVSEKMSVRELFQISRVGISATFLSGVVMSAFSAVGPIYALRVGLELTQVSKFMGLSILAAMAFQWPIGLLSNHYPRRQVILGVTLSALVAAILAALFGSSSSTALFLTVALFTGFSSCLYALSLAFIHDTLDHSQIVPASSTLLLCFGIGTIIGPIAGSLTMSILGSAGLFIFIAVILGLLALQIVKSEHLQAEPSVEEQTVCVTVGPVSAGVIMELDPRNEEFQDITENDDGSAGKLNQSQI